MNVRLTIDFVLLAVACACFALATVGVSPRRVGLVPLGLLATTVLLARQ